MSIEVGAEFNNYEDLTNAIKAYEGANFVNLIIRDTRKVESAAKRNQRKCYNAAIKYSDITYCCTYGGKKFVSQSTGKRNYKTIKQSCPFTLKLRATVDGQKLFVRELYSTHNHEISEAEFRLHPKQRKLDRGSQEEIATLLSMEPDKKLLREKLMQITGKMILMKDIHNIKSRLVNPKVKSGNVEKDHGACLMEGCSEVANEEKVKISRDDVQQDSQQHVDIHGHDPTVSSSLVGLGHQNTLSENNQYCYLDSQIYQQPSAEMYTAHTQHHSPSYSLTSQPFPANPQHETETNIMSGLQDPQGIATSQWTTLEELGQADLHFKDYQTIATLSLSDPLSAGTLIPHKTQEISSTTMNISDTFNPLLAADPGNVLANHEYAQDPSFARVRKRRWKNRTSEAYKKKKKSAVQADKESVIKKYFQQATVNLFFNERFKSSGSDLVKSFKQAAMTDNAQYHAMLKPLSWLFGKWRSEEGKGQYPTIADFTYGEEAEFFPIGMKPIIEYKSYSWKPDTKMQLHRETGFIRIKPDSNHIAFMAAHNLGVVEIQEGEVHDQELTVQTTNLGRTSFNKPPEVKSVIRTLKRKGSELEQVLQMQTDKTEMTQHLKISLKKLD